MRTLSLLFVPPAERRRNGDFYEVYGNAAPHVITIQEDGNYTIEIDGRNVKGEIEVIITK